MKYSTLSFILLASLSALHATEVTPPESSTAAPAATPASALPASVRAYQLEYLAGVYESYATLTQQGKLGDPNAMTLLFIDHQRRIPTADLPANCQAYIADLRAVFTEIYDLLNAGKYEEAHSALDTLTKEVKAKHPEAAKLMEDESFTRPFISKIETEANAIAEEKLKSASDEADQEKIVVELFTEMATKVRAAKATLQD